MKSPNFGPRRDGLTPDLVVVHYTAMGDCASAARALCDPLREVSAHYLIGRDGAVLNLVPEAMRAWHAGAGEWRGAGDVNSRSIGIELDNDGVSPFPEPLMTALCTLLETLLTTWDMGPEAVIGHSDMAPGRKIDPGRRFDWQRLARLGLAVWSDARDGAVDTVQFRHDARAFGYPDVEDTLLLDVVRMRFRPWAHGSLDGDDCAIMADLAARYGLDRGDRGA